MINLDDRGDRGVGLRGEDTAGENVCCGVGGDWRTPTPTEEEAVANDESEGFRLMFGSVGGGGIPPLEGPTMTPEGVDSEPALRTRERRRLDNDDDKVLGAITGGAEAIDAPESNRSRNARMSSLARSDTSLLPKLLSPPRIPASAPVFPPGTAERPEMPPSPTRLLRLLVLDIRPILEPTVNVGVTGEDGGNMPPAPELLALDFRLGIALLPFPAAPLKRAAHPTHILSTRTSGSLSGRAEAAREVLARCSGRENMGGLGFDGDAGCC